MCSDIVFFSVLYSVTIVTITYIAIRRSDVYVCMFHYVFFKFFLSSLVLYILEINSLNSVNMMRLSVPRFDGSSLLFVPPSPKVKWERHPTIFLSLSHFPPVPHLLLPYIYPSLSHIPPFAPTQARGSRQRCKLPKRGLGRSPSQN